MYAFLVLVVLAVGLSVLLQAIDELVPVRVPAALTRVTAIAVGTGIAWLTGYSAFAAFDQPLRAEWMHPVMTGLALVAVGELVRSLVDAFTRRVGAAAGGTAPSSQVRAA